MARTIPADRFAAVVAAAARVFISHGYQRAQVQDVADVLGLGKGTLYGYAQGKAALFAVAVRYADGHEPLPAPVDLPVPAPADGEVAALVADRLAAEVAELRLVRALAASTGSAPTGSAPTGFAPTGSGATAVDEEAVDEETELAAVVTDLYQRLARHRIAIKLVDRCAPEIPGLARVWFGVGRQAQVSAMEEYLACRQRAGALVLPGPADLVARTIVELCALWAVHCHFDPAPPPLGAPRLDPVDDTAVAAMLAQLLVRATAPARPLTAAFP